MLILLLYQIFTKLSQVMMFEQTKGIETKENRLLMFYINCVNRNDWIAF